jgi:hypothetical protein
METSTEPFGRVDPGGIVSVRESDQWRPVGSFPDGTPEEALAYFQRKFADLAAGVVLAEQRLKAQAPIKDLRAQVKRLTEDLVAPAAVGNLAALRTRVQAIADALPAREEEQKAATEAEVTEGLALRTDLVEQIEKLGGQDPAKIRWKQASETVTALFEAWQNHQQTGPRLPKKEADELWNRFRRQRTQLERARRAHFAQLDGQSKEAKTIKRDFIAQAEALVARGAAGIPAYRALLEKWKTAPRASRSTEDALWAQFKAAGDALYAEKAEQDKKDDEVDSVNFEKKTALLEEFKDILSITDRARGSERLRAFHTRFAALGPVPKKNIRAIDDQVKKLDVYVKTLNEEFWVKNDPEKKARSSSMADQLKDGIAKLESQIAGATGAEKDSLVAELETKRSWLAVVDA